LIGARLEAGIRHHADDIEVARHQQQIREFVHGRAGALRGAGKLLFGFRAARLDDACRHVECRAPQVP
jgi:hypothetical protein